MNDAPRKNAFNPAVLRKPDLVVDAVTGKTLLIDAVLNDDVELLERLLEAGASPNKTASNGKTALHFAASLGFAESARRLLDAGANVNARDANLETPLLEAWKRPEPEEMIDLLLSRGGNPDIGDKTGKTLLHAAAHVARDNSHIARDTAKDLSLLKKLLAASSNPDQPNHSGVTPFMLACRFSPLPVVKAFLFERVSLSAIDQGRNNCLHHAAANPDEEVCAFLLAGEAARLVNTINNAGQSPLHIAVSKKRNRLVQAMHGVGANINLQDADGQTPTHEAAGDGNLDLVKLLISLGADIAKMPTEKSTPLTVLAARAGDRAMMELFLSLGADIDAQGSDGETALMQSAASCDASMVEFLLGLGADASKKDRLGCTVLHHGVACLPGIVLRQLIKAGAPVDARDEWQRTALLDAVRANNPRAALELLQASADPNLTDAQGNSPLHIAVSQNNLAIMEALLAAKADPDICGLPRKMTPLHLACGLGFDKEAALLLKWRAKPDPRDHMGRTPLYGAMMNPYGFRTSETLAKLLLQYGADPLNKDRYGATPYDVAYTLDRPPLLELFRKELAKKGKKHTPKHPSVPPWGMR